MMGPGSLKEDMRAWSSARRMMGRWPSRVGQREDISSASLKELLSKSEDGVRRDLIDAAQPERKAAINEAIAEIATSPGGKPAQRDFGPAQRAILALHQAGALNEKALLDFCPAAQIRGSDRGISRHSQECGCRWFTS